MNKKIALIALLILLTTCSIANGKVRKGAKKDVPQTTVTTEEQEPDDEIDNYDFVYGTSDELNLEYNTLRQQSITTELLDILGGQVQR